MQAPIVPHVSSLDDTRHFSHLPLPPAEDIPGLMRNDVAPGVDSLNCAFAEF